MGVPHRFLEHASLSPKVQDALNQPAGEQSSDQGLGEPETPGKIGGHDGGSPPSHPPSTTSLPLLGERQIWGIETGPHIPGTCGGHTGHEDGPELVDQQRQQPQWESHRDSPMAYSHRDRCLEEGLGSMLSTGGPWTEREQQHSINYLELLAAFLGLQTFA